MTTLLKRVALGALALTTALVVVWAGQALVLAVGGWIFAAVLCFFLIKMLAIEAKETFGKASQEEEVLLEKVRRWKPKIRLREFRTLRKYLSDQDLEQFVYARRFNPYLTTSGFLALKRESEIFRKM